MLKSRSAWPPGGWKFRQPQTNWTLPVGLGFEQSVDAIIKHRLANRQHKLAIDRDVVRQELDDFMCDYLRRHPQYSKSWNSWCSEQTVPANFTVPPASRSLRAEASVAEGGKFLKNTSAGIKLWIDWFGNGKPVEKPVAERRAAICAGCNENNKKVSILQWFTGAAAREIMAIFSALNDLNLHTSQDDKLNVCKACDCPLKAKVWAPLQIIKKHIRKDALDRLDKDCWIRHEKIE
jgi:hypothetical protein